MRFSFLHTADIHLGRLFSQFSKFSYNFELADIYNKAVEKCLEKIYETAVSKQVDFVLIAGDTFNSSEHDFSSKLLLKTFLDRLDSECIKVFLICGNHDALSSYNKNTFNYDDNSNIKIIGLNTDFYGEFPVFNKKNEYICKVHALSFREETFNENPVKYFSKAGDYDFHIGLIHCDLNAGKSSEYAPCSVSDLKELNYDYYALGHIHAPAEYDSNIIYSGTVQGRNIKETGMHGIRYIEAESKNIVKNEFIQSDVIRFENIKADITNALNTLEAFQLVIDRIRLFMEDLNDSCEKYLLKISLTGQTVFYNEINDEFGSVLAEKIRNEFSKKVYMLEFSNESEPCIREDILKNDEGIFGELYRTAGNEDLANQLYDEVYSSVINAVKKCNYTNEELEELKQDVIKTAGNECKSIAGSLYSDNEDRYE